MKNSAWYHKLWRKKLGEYPLRDDPDASWTEMQALLDKAMPAQNADGNKKPGKFWGGTPISMLGFILPAAAMIVAVTFAVIKHSKKTKTDQKHHYQLPLKKAKDTSKEDTGKNVIVPLKTDSTTHNIPKNTTRAHTGIMKNSGIRLQQTFFFNPKNKTGSGRASLRTRKLQISFSAGQSGANTGRSIVNQLAVDDGKGPLLLSGGADKRTDTSLLNPTKSGIGNGMPRANYPGAKAQATGKRSAATSVKAKDVKSPKNDSKFDFGIDGGINISGAGSSPAFGLTGTAGINPKWLIEAGIRMDLSRPFSIDITHPTYNRPDSTFFKVQDSRKMTVLSVPVNIAYKVSDKVSIYAGPQINFSVNQSKPVNKLRTVSDYRDTLSHSRSIDSALEYNSINKVNVGVSAGVSIRISSHFYIDGTYQQNISPYKVSTGLGDNKQYYRSFQLGLHYRFKKKSN